MSRRGRDINARLIVAFAARRGREDQRAGRHACQDSNATSSLIPEVSSSSSTTPQPRQDVHEHRLIREESQRLENAAYGECRNVVRRQPVNETRHKPAV
jgi:hypothetical protein